MKKTYLLLLSLLLVFAACEKQSNQQQEEEQISLIPEEGKMTDPRDGNEYVTVKLGRQVWMAENLRYLPEGERQYFDISATSPRYYVIFDNDLSQEIGIQSVKVYGMFYNLPAATQGEVLLSADEDRTVQGICPDGWRLPSQADWNGLAQYVVDAGMAATLPDGTVDETAVAKALASADMWIMPEATEIEPQQTWVAYDPTTNNASKFNGKPIGFRACSVGPGEDVWMHACYSAGWWSSSAAVEMLDMGVDFGIPVRMWSDLQTFVTVSEFHPGVGLPVRCIKDQETIIQNEKPLISKYLSMVFHFGMYSQHYHNK